MSFINKYLKNNYILLFIVGISCAISAFFRLLSGVIVSFILDNVLNDLPITNPLTNFINSFISVEIIKEDYLYIIYLVIIIFAVYCLSLFIRYFLQAIISENMTKKIRDDLFSHIQKLNYRYHVQCKTGELIQKCTTDVDIIRRFFAGQLSELIQSLFLIIIAIFVLMQINVSLTYISIILLPLLSVYALFFFNKISKVFTKLDNSEGNLTAYIQEALSGIRVIKAFNTEKYELNKFIQLNNDFKEKNYALICTLGKYWSSSDFLCLLQIGIVLAAGVLYANNNYITLGDFYIFLIYISMIVWPVRNIGRLLADAGKMKVSINRLEGILNEVPEDYTSGSIIDLNGDIVFNNVSFSYDDKKYVLNDLNFTIKQGETIALVGPTASGKSTLISLLNRMYQPTKGNITINNVDINDINIVCLRRNINVVLQEPFLFSKSIYENIKLTDASLNEDSIKQASINAHIYKDIMEFKEGYNTIVGEKGVTLSGGQRQRLAIARTIINESPIIIFDDSLSAVDSHTDSNIRQSLKKYNSDKTIIIITQRINSAMDADKIIVLENGSITDIDTHNNLINKDGLYKRIYDIQSKMIDEDSNEKFI